MFTACELHDNICYSTSPYHIQVMDASTQIRAVAFEPAAKKLLFKADTAHIQVFTALAGPLSQQLHCMLRLLGTVPY